MNLKSQPAWIPFCLTLVPGLVKVSCKRALDSGNRLGKLAVSMS